MNSRPPQYTKIGRDISLEDHLNRTAPDHNGHGYREYMAQRHLKGMTKTALADYMGVDRRAIDRWIEAEPKVQG